jgi:hypothetical protein
LKPEVLQDSWQDLTAKGLLGYQTRGIQLQSQICEKQEKLQGQYPH